MFATTKNPAGRRACHDETFVQGGDTAGEAARVLIEDVHDAIFDLVELIKDISKQEQALEVVPVDAVQAAPGRAGRGRRPSNSAAPGARGVPFPPNFFAGCHFPPISSRGAISPQFLRARWEANGTKFGLARAVCLLQQCRNGAVETLSRFRRCGRRIYSLFCPTFRKSMCQANVAQDAPHRWVSSRSAWILNKTFLSTVDGPVDGLSSLLLETAGTLFQSDL